MPSPWCRVRSSGDAPRLKVMRGFSHSRAGSRLLLPRRLAGVRANVRPLVWRTLVTGCSRAATVAVNERGSVRVVLAGERSQRADSVRRSRQAPFQRRGRRRSDRAPLEERGINAVRALRGAFALALWDVRQQKMLCARDQLGVVPLYYAADGGRLACRRRWVRSCPDPASEHLDASALDSSSRRMVPRPPRSTWRPGSFVTAS